MNNDEIVTIGMERRNEKFLIEKGKKKPNARIVKHINRKIFVSNLSFDTKQIHAVSDTSETHRHSRWVGTLLVSLLSLSHSLTRGYVRLN